MADWQPGQKIERLYAWVSTEPDGGEGVCGATIMFNGRETFMPLIGADKARIESYRDYAAGIAAASGYPVRLVEFTGRKDHMPIGNAKNG